MARPNRRRLPGRAARSMPGRESCRGFIDRYFSEETAMSYLKNLQSKNQRWLSARPTRRPGEARRRVLMEELEQRTVLSNFVLSGTAGDDVILFRRDPSNFALAQVQVNGSVLFDAPVSAGDTMTLNGLDGDDTIKIEDTFFGV